jgi:hypothetical protein
MAIMQNIFFLIIAEVLLIWFVSCEGGVIGAKLRSLFVTAKKNSIFFGRTEENAYFCKLIALWCSEDESACRKKTLKTKAIYGKR